MARRTSFRISSMAALAAAGLATAVVATPAYAATTPDTSELREAVTVEGIQEHLVALQAIADANDDNRASGTSGHVASAEYVEAQLQAAGYETERQYFSYEREVFDALALDQVAPNPTEYAFFDDFYPFSFIGETDVTAPVTAVDVNLGGDRASTSGCEAADFVGFPAGHIALLQRGTCDFVVKVANAEAAGAVGVVIFNQGNDVPGDDRFGVFAGTLETNPSDVTVFGISFDLGAELVNTPGLELHLAYDASTELVETFNVLADTGGREDRQVVVGGHLDSVAEGPGINDNGSGIGAILETALQIAELGIEPRNQIRFAFWSGEEDGLIGSTFYVSQLTEREIKNTAVNLNFDMLGSPNAVRFVYDGDGSAFGGVGPNGSDVVEDVFLDFFGSQGLATEPTAFDGRSDYFGFINAGIPAGGLFSGAEGIKSAEQAAIYGGTAGVAYDPCYHAACDTIANFDPVVLGQMADAVAHSTLVFGETRSAVNGTGKGNGHGPADLAFKGNRSLH